jgi:hypothetical protein
MKIPTLISVGPVLEKKKEITNVRRREEKKDLTTIT